MLNTWRRKEKLSIGLPIGFSVLNFDVAEAVSDRASALVSCEDALTWRCDFTGCLNEFLLVCLLWVNHLQKSKFDGIN